MVFCWNVTLIAAVLAAILLAYAALAPIGPAQQLASAALAVGMVVIPYVFSRAIEALRQ